MMLEYHGCAVLHGQGTGDGGEHGANEFQHLEYFCPVYFHIDQELENLTNKKSEGERRARTYQLTINN